MSLTSPKLWVVATPLGNPGDLSPRAREVLEGADMVLAEDTRRAGLLCQRCGVKAKRFMSFHDHNEESKLDEVLGLLNGGRTLALISDAGLPLVADPGYRLVRACRAAGILGKKQDALCALFDKKDRVECARVLESLLSTGELVLLAPELCVEKNVLDAVGARARVWFETHDTLTLGEFRDALGTSRDHALLVLEYNDRLGILRREGDVRRPGAQFGEIEK